MTKRHYEIDLREISTPSQKWDCLTTGAIDRPAVERAEAHRFDQIPVLNEKGDLCGIIATRIARALLDSGKHLSAGDSVISFVQIEAKPRLLRLLDVLAEERSVFFQSHPGSEEPTLGPDGWQLTTISDLNRHSFRAHLYPIFAELESLIATDVRAMFNDHWAWLKHLDPRSQASLIGNWEIAKRNSVDTDVLSGCTLTELLNVASKDERVRERLCVESKNQFDKKATRIKDVRNKIMHPVRPLILNQEDVEDLRDTLDSVMTMSTRLLAA